MTDLQKQPADDHGDNIGNVDPMVEVEMKDRDLPVPLTEQERLQIGEELAQAQDEAEQAEDKKKAVDEEYKGVIDKAYSKVSGLSRKLRHGKAVKPVQCRITKDYRLGWVRVVRLDDGTEVDSRPMTADEQQIGMSFGQE